MALLCYQLPWMDETLAGLGLEQLFVHKRRLTTFLPCVYINPFVDPCIFSSRMRCLLGLQELKPINVSSTIFSMKVPVLTEIINLQDTEYVSIFKKVIYTTMSLFQLKVYILHPKLIYSWIKIIKNISLFLSAKVDTRD